jgi:hypothetical protein
MGPVLLNSDPAIPMLATLLAHLALSSALMALVLHKINAHLPMVVLLALHSSVLLVTVLILRLQTVPLLNVLLALPSSV